VARELIVLPRFKRDYRIARKHAEFDRATLEYVFDVLISGTKPPEQFQEHTECGIERARPVHHASLGEPQPGTQLTYAQLDK
jgi:mRNA-degrading endonuclease YafQ of YafQ-DinJ toxin-antitoxin module